MTSACFEGQFCFVLVVIIYFSCFSLGGLNGVAGNLLLLFALTALSSGPQTQFILASLYKCKCCVCVKGNLVSGAEGGGSC